MSSFTENWQKAGEDADDFEPDKGTYKTLIVDGGAFTSRAGDDYAKVVLQIAAGDDAGRRFQHFMGFKHEVGARINREALALYGVVPSEINTVEDLDDAIQALVKAHVEAEVAVSYKDGFMQVKVLGSRTPDRSDIPTDDEPQKPAASFAAAAKSDDGDLPF